MAEDNFIINEHLKFKNNFLDKNLIECIYSKVNSPACLWHKQYSSPEKKDNFFWYLPLKEENIIDNMFVEEVKMLEEKVEKKIIRIYVNGQSINQQGSFHYDDGEETILIGLTKEMTPTLGGATEFLAENDTSHLIYPIYNRAIFFNAKLTHRASSSSYPFRLTLALKTIKAI